MNMSTHLWTATLMTVVTTVLLGLVYPLVVTGLAQVLFPDQANGQLIERDGTVIGSRIIGQPFTLARLLLLAAVGGRHRLRRRRLVRLEPRTDQQEADRSRRRRRGAAAGGQSRRAGADRPGDDLGLRARPAHQPGRGRCSRCRASRASAASREDAVRAAGGRAHRGPPVRLPRRTGRQRAAAEPGARRARADAAVDAMTDDHRPSADALLARIKDAGAGAPAHLHRRRARRRQDLRDAAGGARAARPRPRRRRSASSRPTAARDTEAQLKDLEVVPRRTIEYRGVTLEEMDVDAIIARQPQVCVVDELAHTNVPGSRHDEALRGRARDPRRRHPRHDRRQHPAPRDAERCGGAGRPACACARRCPTRSSSAPTK